MNEPPKYAYPYPAQGYYQGPPVMAPPPQYAAPHQRDSLVFLKDALQLYAAVACLTSVAVIHL